MYVTLPDKQEKSKMTLGDRSCLVVTLGDPAAAAELVGTARR
jgi:hypothetical protein